MKKSSIFTRESLPFQFDNPFPTINGEYVMTESGEKKFVERPVVQDCFASDFNVISRALYGQASAPAWRDSADPVDLNEKYPELFD